MSRAAVLIPRAGPAYAAAFTGALAGALLMGAAAGMYPKYALALCVGILAFAFAFRFPVAHLLTLLFVSALIPLTLQSRFGSGGGPEAAGVLPTDVLVLAGLARAIVKLPNLPLDRRATRALLLCAGLLAVVFLQLIQARYLGRSMSGVGAEARNLMAFATALMAIPILTDPAGRARLLRGSVVLGILLGLWGIAQFALQLEFDVPTDLGGSSQETFNTAGRVVGMYAFPVAALMALSVLASGTVRGAGMRGTLAAIVALNLGALTLTFERTFFIAFAAGLSLIVLRTSGRQRVRVLAWAPALVLATALALAVLTPKAFDATSQRLGSVKNYESDPSVIYREYEGRLVANRIRAHPLTGSGLGASILIGRPGTNQPIKHRRYAENGYLWLVWKLGALGAAVLLALVAFAIVGRPLSRDPLERAITVGAQASLFALAVATLAFPAWNQLAITPLIGVLIALAVCRVHPSRTARQGAPA